MEQKQLDEQYWSERYLKDDAGWDIGYPSTPLKTYIDQLVHKDIAILIPGGGNSYEGTYLLEKGFNDITIADISEVVCDKLRNQFKGKDAVKVIHDNFFNLIGQYDLILEQTFFCALDPSLRKSYVDKTYELLKPGGKLVGVMFNTEFAGGPPFSGSKKEYLGLFSGDFDVVTMDDCYNSIERRAGTEVFVKLVKRS